MKISNIIPPFFTIPFPVRMFINAKLSQIFHHDISSFNISLCSVVSAVFSPTKAVILFVLLGTMIVLTRSKNIMRSHQDIGTKSFVYFFKSLDEIKGFIVSRSIPNIIFNSIIWSCNIEINSCSNLRKFFLLGSC